MNGWKNSNLKEGGQTLMGMQNVINCNVLTLKKECVSRTVKELALTEIASEIY
jgi:hypothetical protein